MELQEVGKNTTANTRYKQVEHLAQFEVGLVFEKIVINREFKASLTPTCV